LKMTIELQISHHLLKRFSTATSMLGWRLRAGNGFQDLANRQITATILLPIKESAVARPRHTRILLWVLVRTNKLRSDSGSEVRIRRWSLARWLCRVSVDATSNVEGVKTKSEVGAVNSRHDFPAVLPEADLVLHPDRLLLEGRRQQLTYRQYTPIQARKTQGWQSYLCAMHVRA
ncbi:hypothetical protein KCU65_g185, partial [Aureobasidium melanogenum]